MSGKPSPRIANYVASLPLRSGLRVLEIGCGPGVAAREVARHIGNGKVLAIDRSAKAIRIANLGSRTEIASGCLELRNIAIEHFELGDDEEPFDLAFAMRVGALDGRHPEIGRLAMSRLKVALNANGLLFIDNRKPIKGFEINA